MMTTALIFNLQLLLGYVAWLLLFSAYAWPKLKAMDGAAAQRAIATLHSFRFFGLVFLVPGVVGTLPRTFAQFAAWGDLATGILAMAALLAFRRRALFWLLIVAFNSVGTADLLLDYLNAVRLGVPDIAGQLGATYVIPIVYVPILMITHCAAFILLARAWRQSGATYRAAMEAGFVPANKEQAD
jgi:hypothetical protein